MDGRFYFGDDSGSDFDDNESNLPFPKPLARSAFLEPDFDPATFLANLSDRYQTLEDLRNELRELSQSLSKELLDLVNHNYQDFLSLGSTLSGGEEKIEEVQVGLLGFQRDLTSVRDNVEHRRTMVSALIEEKKALVKDIHTGRSMLEIAELIGDLETALMLRPTNGNVDDTVQDHHLSDESENDADDIEMSVPRLERLVEQYLILKLLIQRHSPTQPFIVNQAHRIAQIKSTLKLDLEGASKQLQSMHISQSDATSATGRLKELLVWVKRDD